MVLSHLFKTATHGVARNKSRSFLTILGIVIGITSIMMVMSLGEGAQNLILGQIQSMGAKTIAIIPGREPSGPMSAAQMMSDSLKIKDVNLLKNKSNLPFVKTVEPIIMGGGVASLGSETYQVGIFGSSQFIQEVWDMGLDSGRFIDAYDVANNAFSVVIGSKVKEELFGNDEAIGEKIKLKGHNFKVVGVLSREGQGIINFDEAAVIPWSTAQQYVFGIKHFHRVIVEVDKETNIGATIKDIEETLRESHGLSGEDKNDFYLVTQEGAKKQVETILNVFTLFLAAIAAISLVVGGVGIMNIMLVSVTERTREIGLRKSLGATGKDIMTQFLLEAVMLTALGGVIGIILGTSLSFATSIILSNYAGLDWAFSFPVSAALMGIGVSAVVGLVFGLYPARQASLKSPIEALRYE
jgi:putative ABC transport system permease protein